LRIHLLIAAFIVVIHPISAQTSKTLDLHRQHSKKSFYVVLAARGGSATGHAFVVWGVEDGVRHKTTVRALGLYPDSSANNCGTLVRTVPGGVLDELKTHSFQAITEELIVRVDEAAYQRSLQVARQWDCRHEFSLFSRDCVEFLRAVGQSLDLDMPRRGMTRWTPQAYVRALMVENAEPQPARMISVSR
jgi:hypothetical protein